MPHQGDTVVVVNKSLIKVFIPHTGQVLLGVWACCNITFHDATIYTSQPRPWDTPALPRVSFRPFREGIMASMEEELLGSEHREWLGWKVGGCFCFGRSGQDDLDWGSFFPRSKLGFCGKHYLYRSPLKLGHVGMSRLNGFGDMFECPEFLRFLRYVLWDDEPLKEPRIGWFLT